MVEYIIATVLIIHIVKGILMPSDTQKNELKIVLANFGAKPFSQQRPASNSVVDGTIKYQEEGDFLAILPPEHPIMNNEELHTFPPSPSEVRKNTSKKILVVGSSGSSPRTSSETKGSRHSKRSPASSFSKTRNSSDKSKASANNGTRGGIASSEYLSHGRFQI